MNLKLTRIPWKGRNVPHALIDIIRGCNVICENCYNTSEIYLKSFDEISKELDLLQEKRDIQSVSIIGGEPLLHPELDKILAMIQSRGVVIELLTNGLLLTDERLAAFKKLGVRVILLHVEGTQKRPDLKDSTKQSVSHLRKKLATLIGKHGIEVGLSVTTYREKKDELLTSLRDALEIPEVNFILVTLYRNVHAIEHLTGNIFEGFRGKMNESLKSDEFKLHDFQKILFEELKLSPMAYLPSWRDSKERRWLSFFTPVFVKKDGIIYQSLAPSFFEPFYLWLSHFLTGHYTFTQKGNPLQIKVHLVMNALFGGAFYKNFKFLFRTLFHKGHLKSLRILVQTAAELDENGVLIFCESCPDAVVKNGSLVPVCVCDRVKKC